MDPVLSQYEVPGLPSSVVAWEATTAGCADYERNGRDGRRNGSWTCFTIPYVDFNVTNSQVKTAAAPQYTCQGKRTFVLNGANMTVTGKDAQGTTYAGTSVPLPANGVIAVARLASPACATYDANNPQTI